MRRQLTTAALLACMFSAGFSGVGGTYIPAATRADFAPHQYQIRYFDRVNGRPGEVGGRSGDMNSLTKTDWDVGFTYTYTTETSGDCWHPRTTITIKSFKINGHQNSTIYLPNDAPQAMKDHEQAHYDINVYAYDQAYAKASVFSRSMLKRQFDGCSMDEAQGKVNDAFNNEYKTPYANWFNELHQALNDTDGNGHNPSMTPGQAYKKVIAERG